ncbi:MAG: SCO family protein [Planctomycetota bacterium]
MRSFLFIPLLLAILSLGAIPAAAQEHVKNLSLVTDPRDYVGYDQKLGAQIPQDLSFNDENGQAVRLVDFAKDRPMVLALVYYSCPRLCTEVLNGSVRMLRAMNTLDIGTDFQFVAVSIDPKDTPEIARAKRDTYLEALGSAGNADGWHFLTGDQESITRLAKTVGFRYVWDEHSEQYAHDGGVIVITPDAVVSRYFFGIEFSPFDVRLALVEAGQGKIGSIIDHVLLLCLHYDPTRGKYGFWIVGALRIAGLLTVSLLAIFMLRSIRRERAAARLSAHGA